MLLKRKAQTNEYLLAIGIREYTFLYEDKFNKLYGPVITSRLISYRLNNLLHGKSNIKGKTSSNSFRGNTFGISSRGYLNNI